MELKVKIDDSQLRAALKRAQRELPYATSLMLSGLAYKGRQEVVAEERSSFRLTRNFLPSQTRYQKATKASQESRVYLTEKADLSAVIEQGGTRQPRRKFIAIRQQGKGRVAQALKRPRVFQDERGVFRRLKGGLSILFSYVAGAAYRPEPFFKRAIERTVSLHLAGEAQRALNRVFKR